MTIPPVHPPYACPGPGSILVLNAIEAFKTAEKKKLLEDSARQIWVDINSGAALALLSRFLLLTFANLKKYNFHYWFAFPSLFPEQPITSHIVKQLGSVWNEQQLKSLQKGYEDFRQANPGVGYFLIKSDGSSVSVYSLKELVLGMSDPSTLETNPGWPLRNFLMLAAQQWGDRVSEVDVMCYRDYTREGKRFISHSLLLQSVKLPYKMAADGDVTGWERNDKTKLSPKMVNLSSSMDPVSGDWSLVHCREVVPILLADSSVDLNLKLMRWRLLPSLDLDTVTRTKCLLLGAGTLGCNVARCLMGWGVRQITLLDNSTVSYSNPVRQSLFTFHDCANGGRHKAQAAVESMKLIFPGVQAEAVDCSIPMPAHSVGPDVHNTKINVYTYNIL